MQFYLFLVNAVVSGYGGLEHRKSTALLCRRDQVPQAEVAFDEKAYQDLEKSISSQWTFDSSV